MTGTATREVYHCVVKRLSLRDPAVIGISPSRDNIKYHVEPPLSMQHLCEMFADNIRIHHTGFPKTLIFCPTIAQCSLIYRTLRDLLENEFTDPPGYPDFHKYRLIDMYTRASSNEIKKKILESFMTEGGKLRLLIATSAFSMGIDCPDICNVIHMGPPSCLVQYVQETGRGGRSGYPSVALLLYGKAEKHLQKSMKDYCANSTECRRNMLFREFLFYTANEFSLDKCKCCDICEKSCMCTNCRQHS